jgi:hypothetical protein
VVLRDDDPRAIDEAREGGLGLLHRVENASDRAQPGNQHLAESRVCEGLKGYISSFKFRGPGNWSHGSRYGR